MPQLGETVAEGTITVWYKSVGDAVSAGERLFEIETDKTSMEVPTTVAGVLSEIRIATGVTVAVGSVVAVVADRESVEQGSDRRAPVISSNAPRPAFDPFHSVRTPERNFGPARLASGVAVTPLARRLAAQSGVELEAIAGSGPDGRITGPDVTTAAQRITATPMLDPARAGVSPAAAIKAMFADNPFEEIALDGMRRAIALRLLDAKQRIPHFYLSVEVAIDRLLGLRTDMNSSNVEGAKLSINDFLIRAMALSLQSVPEANAVWAEQCILRLRHSDVAAAVAVAGGLYTPIIRQAELKSVSAISRELKALVERARGPGLKPDEYRGGSITVSNLGMYGVRAFSAIINPPQSAILAVGAAERRPVEDPEGRLRFETRMSLTLSCDHRVIDGVVGARLLAAFKQAVEAPGGLC